MNEILEAVEEATATCWWERRRDLDLPACQLSKHGRILRANPSFLRRFGKEIEGAFCRLCVEQAGDEMPTQHPIARTFATGRACCNFVSTPHGQFQLACLPDQFDGLNVQTVSVLITEMGNRAGIYRFAGKQQISDLRQLYEFIVGCAVELGYPRVRLYLTTDDGQCLRGTASRGFRSEESKHRFENDFTIDLGKDEFIQRTLAERIPVLAIYDPAGSKVGLQSELVQTCTTRNYEKVLEKEDVNRWIDAPLVVPGCGTSTSPVLGKLVVDCGFDSDCLTIRDALDVGGLAMMAAGAIHSFKESVHQEQLERKKTFLSNLLDVLPLLASEKDDTKFYRATATILSCHEGLCWDKVMLFVVDSSGLRQATCVMALGGLGEPEQEALRQRLATSFQGLRSYVSDALSNPIPVNDRLHQAWVAQPSVHQTVSFGPHTAHQGPVAKILARQSTDPWLVVDVTTDEWCQRVNRDIPGTFTFVENRLFAFPLSKSFAVDVEFSDEYGRDQPVGVAVMGMESPERSRNQDLHFTRVVLDLLGVLIAQRWTFRRLGGMFGALRGFYHPKLNDVWEQFKRAADEYFSKTEHDQFGAIYKQKFDDLDEAIGQVLVAQATMKKYGSGFKDVLDLREFLEDHRGEWQQEWAQSGAKCRLTLNMLLPSERIEVPCDPLILKDVMTCLIENAVQVATERERDSVLVSVSTRKQSGPLGIVVEIDVQDDAGGVDPKIEPYVFLKGVSGRSGGGGRGLALARAQLLNHSGDLQYLHSRGGSAAFRIIFWKDPQDVQQRDARVQPAHRRQPS